jgi:hypothetical protein
MTDRTAACPNCHQPMQNGPGGTGPWCWDEDCTGPKITTEKRLEFLEAYEELGAGGLTAEEVIELTELRLRRDPLPIVGRRVHFLSPGVDFWTRDG